MIKFSIVIVLLLILSGCISNAIQPPPSPKPSLSYFIDPNTKVNWKKTVHAKPLYPRRELSKGIEGWVAVKYDISKSGITENISVIDSSPLSVFDKSAMEAVRQFKYVINDNESPTPKTTFAVMNFAISKEYK